MKITTFNIQNTYFKQYCDKYYIKKLKEFVVSNNIDILCLQEATPKGMIELNSIFNDYNIYGEGRLKKYSLIKLYRSSLDENLPIITKYSFKETKSYWLSRRINKKGSTNYLSFFPRIVNACVLDTDLGEIVVINVHLDFVFEYTKKKQILILKQILEIYKNKKIILLGDFNIDYDSELFKYLIDITKPYKLKHIDYDKKTNGSGRIDHIFVDESFNIEQLEIKSTGLSDHKALTLTLK